MALGCGGIAHACAEPVEAGLGPHGGLAIDAVSDSVIVIARVKGVVSDYAALIGATPTSRQLGTIGPVLAGDSGLAPRMPGSMLLFGPHPSIMGRYVRPQPTDLPNRHVPTRHQHPQPR
jgi:hypothetical protein